VIIMKDNCCDIKVTRTEKGFCCEVTCCEDTDSWREMMSKCCGPVQAKNDKDDKGCCESS